MTGMYWLAVAMGGAVGAMGRAAIAVTLTTAGGFPYKHCCQHHRFAGDRCGVGGTGQSGGPGTMECLFNHRGIRWVHYLFNVLFRDGAALRARCVANRIGVCRT